MKRHTFPESLCDYYEVDEVDSIIAEKDREIWELRADLETSRDESAEKSTETLVLREQLRASNEALVAAEARIAELKVELKQASDDLFWSPRGPSSEILSRIDNLTALAEHDKEVRAKTLEDAAVKYGYLCGKQLREMAAELRAKKE